MKYELGNRLIPLDNSGWGGVEVLGFFLQAWESKTFLALWAYFFFEVQSGREVVGERLVASPSPSGKRAQKPASNPLKAGFQESLSLFSSGKCSVYVISVCPQKITYFHAQCLSTVLVYVRGNMCVLLDRVCLWSLLCASLASHPSNKYHSHI